MARAGAAGYTPVSYAELSPASGADLFHRAISEGKRSQGPAGGKVTVYGPDDYRAMRLFLSEDGKGGFALHDDDIVSVFKHADSPVRSATRSMMRLATEQGGQRLDAFDTVLPKLYSKDGFRAVARLSWDDTYAPKGWDYRAAADFNGGRPDVVFMVHDPSAGPYRPGDGAAVSSYEAGTAAQRRALAGNGSPPSTGPSSSALVAGLGAIKGLVSTSKGGQTPRSPINQDRVGLLRSQKAHAETMFQALASGHAAGVPKDAGYYHNVIQQTERTLREVRG